MNAETPRHKAAPRYIPARTPVRSLAMALGQPDAPSHEIRLASGHLVLGRRTASGEIAYALMSHHLPRS
jgi:hypothetical protein